MNQRSPVEFLERTQGTTNVVDLRRSLVSLAVVLLGELPILRAKFGDGEFVRLTFGNARSAFRFPFQADTVILLLALGGPEFTGEVDTTPSEFYECDVALRMSAILLGVCVESFAIVRFSMTPKRTRCPFGFGKTTALPTIGRYRKCLIRLGLLQERVTRFELATGSLGSKKPHQRFSPFSQRLNAFYHRLRVSQVVARFVDF